MVDNSNKYLLNPKSLKTNLLHLRSTTPKIITFH